MASRNGSPPEGLRSGPVPDSDPDSVLGSALTTRHIEAFSRKMTTTASHLMGPLVDPTTSIHYQSAMSGLQKELRRPGIQQRVFSYAQAGSPTELVRSKLSRTEIQHRALAYLPDELLANIPENEHTYSLFQGFQASLPERESRHRKNHRRQSSRGQKFLEEDDGDAKGPKSVARLKKDRDDLNHRLEMMGVRKNMCSSEIREIDNKIANLNSMRRIVLDRLGDLEQDEAQVEQELIDVDNKIEDLEEAIHDAATLAHTATPPTEAVEGNEHYDSDDQPTSPGFMSASIYEKIPSLRSKRHKTMRRKSVPIRHEHFEPGSSIREFQAHNDQITALDFDVPFGTLVTSALDDTVRVWDLNLGRCIGLLEGHQASVRCLQVEDNICATGSMDASIRLWDLSRADYSPQENRIKEGEEDEEDGLGFGNPEDLPPPPHPSSMQDCPLFSLEAHVNEITALHFRGDTLVSGSADKTLRQWDLVKGRCVQTLDVLWAAAQASVGSVDGQWRNTGRLPDASADFVGALQCFDAALACGTADGMVRLWDLRSGQVRRSLVGHTGPVTTLQFDDVHLVTGSLDRSIRIWDLRAGSIHDAFAYDNPITSMMFDARRIAAAAGEPVAKIYDKTDGRHWDCGAGVAAEAEGLNPAAVERLRLKDGYMTEGRKDGIVGIWTC